MTVVVVGHEKGGVGKTRLATQLAVLAASMDVDTVLLDTDIQGTAMEWGEIRKAEGIEPRVSVLSISSNPTREVEDLSRRYQLVVVDIGAQNYATMIRCAVIANLVLVPVGNDQGELSSTIKVFRELRSKDAFHPSGKIPAHAILMRVSPREDAKDTQELRELLAEMKIPVMRSQIAYRSSWKAAGKSGRALHELRSSERSYKATAEIQAVYDEILELTGSEE